MGKIHRIRYKYGKLSEEDKKSLAKQFESGYNQKITDIAKDLYLRFGTKYYKQDYGYLLRNLLRRDGLLRTQRNYKALKIQDGTYRLVRKKTAS